MVGRGPMDEVSTGVQDKEAFKEACDLFGHEGALMRLRKFGAELDECVRRIEQSLPDRDALREMAHQTVFRAGILGFSNLADASMDLEDAIRQKSGEATAIEQWTRQARLAAAVSQDGIAPPASDAT